MTLDVHALAELRDRSVPPTDDSPKYNYKKDHGSHYGTLLYSPPFVPCCTPI